MTRAEPLTTVKLAARSAVVNPAGDYTHQPAARRTTLTLSASLQLLMNQLAGRPPPPPLVVMNRECYRRISSHDIHVQQSRLPRANSSLAIGLPARRLK